MTTSIAVTMKSSLRQRDISFDLWKIIIEFLNDENIGRGYNAILPNRLIDKAFSATILECIKEVRFNLSHGTLKVLSIVLSRPVSLQKLITTCNLAVINYGLDQNLSCDLICGCKELRSLKIDVGDDLSLTDSEELQKIGNSCTKIEVMHLTLRNLHVVPPSNMQNWINLRSFIAGEHVWNNSLWIDAISMLPELKEIKIRSSRTFNGDIINFCNMCKGKPICQTLEVFESSSNMRYDIRIISLNEQDYVKLSDDGLYSVLDTFLNLKEIELKHTNITLTRTDIVKKLGNLNQLKKIYIHGSHLFFDRDLWRTEDWLRTSLPYFPKSLEVIQLLDCDVYVYGNNDGVRFGLYPSEATPIIIKSEFHNALPNLRKIDVTFKVV
jgi:hypothetical protein